MLCTHWHDDHIGGISELLRACTGAVFACSSALTETEFLKVLQAFNKRALIVGSGLSEIHSVFSILRSRKRPPKFAIADRPLFRLATDPLSPVAKCELTALSPTDGEFQRFSLGISKLMPTEKTAKYRLPSLRQNDLSVAAWLKIGSLQILLGAPI